MRVTRTTGLPASREPSMSMLPETAQSFESSLSRRTWENSQCHSFSVSVRCVGLRAAVSVRSEACSS